MDNDHKLIILYFLSSINSSINSMDITNFLLDNNYTDYLQAQQYFSELVESGLINQYQKENKIFYKINENGNTALELFENRLDDSHITKINEFMNNYKDLPHDTFTTTFDYDCISEDCYNIRCIFIKNEQTLLELGIPNTSAAKLKRIKNQWELNSKNILKFIQENLLR